VTEPPWEALEHTSDLELLIRGSSEEELFANAALALLGEIVEPQSVRPMRRRRLRLKAQSTQERFLDWLRELLYLVMVRGFVVCRAEKVRLARRGGEYILDAVVSGEKLDERRHRLLHEVKTVTYQDFSYGRERGFWQARVVFDV